MRPYFTDYARLKRQAKRAVNDGASYVHRWWSQKYKRPANDPLFEERGMSEWVREMYEDLYERKAEIVSQLEDDMTPMREKSIRLRRPFAACMCLTRFRPGTANGKMGAPRRTL